jgi:hypothetical protein
MIIPGSEQVDLSGEPMIDIDGKSSDIIADCWLILLDICFDMTGMTMRHAGMMDVDPGQVSRLVFQVSLSYSFCRRW